MINEKFLCIKYLDQGEIHGFNMEYKICENIKFKENIGKTTSKCGAWFSVEKCDTWSG